MLLLLAGASVGRAGLVVTAGDSVAPAGGNGHFDVILTNDSTDTVGIAGLSIELAVDSSSGITFTGGSSDFDPSVAYGYIFDGLDTFGLVVTPDGLGLTVTASDLLSDPIPLDLGQQTVGLARIFYSVGSGAGPADVPVELTSAIFSDALGNPIVDESEITRNPGMITVTGGVNPIPEPSTLASASIAAGCCLVLGIYRRRRQ